MYEIDIIYQLFALYILNSSLILKLNEIIYVILLGLRVCKNPENFRNPPRTQKCGAWKTKSPRTRDHR